jgi:exodeoxyribonuclease V alpha subunit
MKKIDTDEPITMKGEISQISSKFWRGGWGHGRLRPSRGEEVRITGCLEGVSVGAYVTLVGKWKEHSKYGTSFEVETLVEEDPVSERGIQRWIIERLPQIGPVRAGDLAKRFGSRLWEVIEHEPHLLLAVNGLTAERVTELVQVYETFKVEGKALIPFYSLGLTRREAKAAKKGGLEADAITQDPFVLYLQIRHVFSFARTELLSQRAQASLTSPARLAAAAVEAVEREKRDGHTACEREQVQQAAVELGDLPWSYGSECVDRALGLGKLIAYEPTQLLMLPALASAEAGLAAKLMRLNSTENA